MKANEYSAEIFRDYRKTIWRPFLAAVRAYRLIEEGDRIEFGGATYVVDGIPYAWKSPTGRVSSKQARLKKWAG